MLITAKIIGLVAAALIVVIMEKYKLSIAGKEVDKGRVWRILKKILVFKKDTEKDGFRSFWMDSLVRLTFAVIIFYMILLTRIMDMRGVATMLIGFLASAYQISIFQEKGKKKMLYLQAIASTLFAIHFFFLAIITPDEALRSLIFISSAVGAVNVVRSIVFAQRYDHKWASKIIWPTLFIAIFWAIGALSFYFKKNGLCFVPPLAMTISTLAFWVKENEVDKIGAENADRFRIIYLPSTAIWFAYNLMSRSYPGMFSDFLSFCSNAVGYIRYRSDKSKA